VDPKGPFGPVFRSLTKRDEISGELREEQKKQKKGTTNQAFSDLDRWPKNRICIHGLSRSYRYDTLVPTRSQALSHTFVQGPRLHSRIECRLCHCLMVGVEPLDQDGESGWSLLRYERRQPGTARRAAMNSFTADGSSPVIDDDRATWGVLTWIPRKGEWKDSCRNDVVHLVCVNSRCKRRINLPLSALAAGARAALGSRGVAYV